MERKMKYYFNWYIQFGAPCSGKRAGDMPQSPNTVEEYEITEDEFFMMSLARCAVKYPFTKIPDLT
jgi:hypothetical protein